MTAYYNEFEPYAAQWLRNLIAAGHIAPGDIDERSIVDVQPDDLKGYVQCHFFTGIGGWSYALRLAGWPDERPVWTGSCPCQPFSVAGKGEGQKDERHLWPEFFRLIGACRPDVVMGEQVAAAVGKDWLDGVYSDLEGIGYALGAAVVPACAVDAPHRRDRLWFVADASNPRPPRAGCNAQPQGAFVQLGNRSAAQDAGCGALAYADGAGVRVEPRWISRQDRAGSRIDRDDQQVSLGDAEFSGLEGQPGHGHDRDEPGRLGTIPARPVATASSFDVADTDLACESEGWEQRGRQLSGPRSNSCGSAWVGAEWLTGADGKARRIEPGIRLLAHGVPARVGKLRAYGNAIVPQVAAEIIGAYMDCAP